MESYQYPESFALPSSEPVVLNSTNNITITFHEENATKFTWLTPVTFSFTVGSNINASIYFRLLDPNFGEVVRQWNVTAGTETFNITTNLSLFIMPGDRLLNFSFSYEQNEIGITHVVWVGSNWTILLSLLGGILVISIVLIAKIREPSLSSSSSPGPISFSSSAGPGGAADDDSAVTYVDQSRAPAGKIFCPECKKLIEEGSIFCPECGTRIPRYLRYHPQS